MNRIVPREVSIEVKLPPDRTKTGTLTIRDQYGNVVGGPFTVYGKADNAAAATHKNHKRDPLKPYGDTPTGTYNAPLAIATGAGTNYSAHSYGPNGALVLEPTDGQAALAKANNRTGLLIHGGDPNQQGLLRPTNGCLRLSNSDMSALLARSKRQPRLVWTADHIVKYSKRTWWFPRRAEVMKDTMKEIRPPVVLVAGVGNSRSNSNCAPETHWARLHQIGQLPVRGRHSAQAVVPTVCLIVPVTLPPTDHKFREPGADPAVPKGPEELIILRQALGAPFTTREVVTRQPPINPTSLCTCRGVLKTIKPGRSDTGPEPHLPAEAAIRCRPSHSASSMT